MGFLDRLVSDMIGESIGVNPRRLIRMVGGRNLLMMGAGAALAGGVASAMARGQEPEGGKLPSQMTGQAQPRGDIPPPPPPPPETRARTVPPPPPPPPPPVEPSAEEEVELPPEATYAVVRAMVAAALADGHLGEREKEVIQARLDESGLSEAEKRQIHRDLVLPPTPAEVAALVPAGEARELLYRFAALVVLADGHASDLERGWLERLARASEIDAARVAELEKEIFAA